MTLLPSPTSDSDDDTPMTEQHTNAELEAEVRASLRGRRFLAPGGRGGNGHGYVGRPQRVLHDTPDPPSTVERIAAATALCDEPEAPGRAWVDAEAELAAEHNRLRHLAAVEQAREIRRGLTVEARLADVARRAKAKRVDVSGDLYVISKMRRRAERAGRTSEPAAALRRLEAIEARLDGVA